MAEKLLKNQTDLLGRLEKAQTNYKKCPKIRITKGYVETRIDTLEKLHAEFNSNHKEIVQIIEPEQEQIIPYFTKDAYDEFEELYVAYMSDLKEIQGRFTENHKPETNTTLCNEVKLPRIQLPTFSGKYEEWQTFFDMFVSLIHKNEKLSAVQKLHYLKSSLQGEAESMLRNFATTEQNYDEAWKQLTKRYNNKRYNSNAILKILFSQNQINTESPHGIKQLLDTTSSCLKALNNMGVRTETWDVIIVYLVVSRLDVESHKQWEQQICLMTEDMPSWARLVEFLEARFRSLEMIDSSKHTKSMIQITKPVMKAKSFHSAIQQQDNKKKDLICVLCGESHYLNLCQQFDKKSVQERRDFIQLKGLCFNCLQPTHVVMKCRLPTCCKKCGRRHHIMLHFDKKGFTEQNGNQGENNQNKVYRMNQPGSSTANPLNRVANFSKQDIMLPSHHVLLATAIIKARSRNGKTYPIRALLDQGSQASFVTEATAQLLGLKRFSVNGVVSGLGGGQTRIKYMVTLGLKSRHNPEITYHVNAYVLGSLTSLLPSNKLETPNWLELQKLNLADPNFALPGKIDVLLGAEVYYEVLSDGIMKQPQGKLLAQNTVFGWVLYGKLSDSSSAIDNVTSLHLRFTPEDDCLKRFWEIEAEPDQIQKRLTKEEQLCEDIYQATTVRNKEGRFVVKLPFKNEDPACQYGQSRYIATKKLIALGRRLTKDPKLYEEYQEVLDEYVTLKHMTLVDAADIDNPQAVYLPHHAVVRDDKDTTKVRVVFNASSKGINDVSLNDDLLIGPKLQQDLRHLLMRFRTHRICIVADLVKMYRQVLVHSEDADFQRILGRRNPNLPIQHYKLLTLTFGTACAPYLAVKTLQRLAEDEVDNFPKASEITKRDYYIDDLMTGCDTEEEARQIYDEMNELMTSGGFQLQKWSSNSGDLLQYIRENKHNKEQSVPIKADNTMKILGLQWNRVTDNFEYTVALPDVKYPITKRQVLSEIARLYDPMGWIAPVVVSAKIIIQRIWQKHLDWDDHITGELQEKWIRFRNDLVEMTKIEIPRWIKSTGSSYCELHAFSDASQAAYAATVYIRVIAPDQTIHVNLISAKTKVAPIDKVMSIPRLELCGATLAAKLLSEISQVMNIPKENLHGWTDSTIVLAWLKGGASKWTTFVSNRVSDILSIMEYKQWQHVSTDTNPADCASRGLQPSEMHSEHLWWHGPVWLKQSKIQESKCNIDDTHEEERIISMKVTQIKEENYEWTKFSSLTKMLKVMSFCRRMLIKTEERQQLPLWVKGYVTVREMNRTLEMCIKQVQGFEFEEEIKSLLEGKEVIKKSPLHTLCPILDQNRLLRVGGRIDQADVSYDTRHPIILPAKSHLTQLLVADAHDKTLHGGPQIMLNFLRSKYWILRAKDQIKRYYRKCITCIRYSKTARVQLMGQLPDVRLKPCKPFKATGVDYAGPINIKFSPGRGAKSCKGYISLFVCMVTRAVHIEAVTDLSTKAFIAAFRRFTSRRGHCQDLYSDNGTNFVGADKQLREMFDCAKSNLPQQIAEALTLESTTWHFIPPQAPNFGGLWEAGVRCAKAHLRKVIGDSTLTYEELSTVLSQVEACLNSRPISVLSNDAIDPLPLTPGHFLIGEPMFNVSYDNYTDCNITGTDRWKLVQKMVSDFWIRWSKEYLVCLSQRYKWNSKLPEPSVNDICIVRDDSLPPTKWLLGRIVDKHTGPDNVTRVVTVRCKNGLLKRPLSKICVIDK